MIIVRCTKYECVGEVSAEGDAPSLRCFESVPKGYLAALHKRGQRGRKCRIRRKLAQIESKPDNTLGDLRSHTYHDRLRAQQSGGIRGLKQRACYLCIHKWDASHVEQNGM